VNSLVADPTSTFSSIRAATNQNNEPVIAWIAAPTTSTAEPVISCRWRATRAERNRGAASIGTRA
jgi:hypothetical protein